MGDGIGDDPVVHPFFEVGVEILANDFPDGFERFSPLFREFGEVSVDRF